MGKPGRLDRFEHFLTCTTGEIAMGAASIRTKESFERLLAPVFAATLPVDVDSPQFWQELEEGYLENGDPDSASTDMWRSAYIYVGMDTAYVRYILEYGWSLGQTNTDFHMANFRFNPSEDIQDPVRVPVTSLFFIFLNGSRETGMSPGTEMISCSTLDGRCTLEMELKAILR